MSAVRRRFSREEVHTMWEWIVEKLRDDAYEPVYKPCGVIIWEDFVAAGRSERHPANLASHYRRQMEGRIMESNLSPKEIKFVLQKLNQRVKITKHEREYLQTLLKAENQRMNRNSSSEESIDIVESPSPPPYVVDSPTRTLRPRRNLTTSNSNFNIPPPNVGQKQTPQKVTDVTEKQTTVENVAPPNLISFDPFADTFSESEPTEIEDESAEETFVSSSKGAEIAVDVEASPAANASNGAEPSTTPKFSFLTRSLKAGSALNTPKDSNISEASIVTRSLQSGSALNTPKDLNISEASVVTRSSKAGKANNALNTPKDSNISEASVVTRSSKAGKANNASNTPKNSNTSEVLVATSSSNIAKALNAPKNSIEASVATKSSTATKALDAFKHLTHSKASNSLKDSDVSKASVATSSSNSTKSSTATKALDDVNASNALKHLTHSKASNSLKDSGASKASVATRISNYAKISNALKLSNPSKASNASNDSNTSKASNVVKASDAVKSSNIVEASVVIENSGDNGLQVTNPVLPPENLTAVSESTASKVTPAKSGQNINAPPKTTPINTMKPKSILSSGRKRRATSPPSSVRQVRFVSPQQRCNDSHEGTPKRICMRPTRTPVPTDADADPNTAAVIQVLWKLHNGKDAPDLPQAQINKISQVALFREMKPRLKQCRDYLAKTVVVPVSPAPTVSSAVNENVPTSASSANASVAEKDNSKKAEDGDSSDSGPFW